MTHEGFTISSQVCDKKCGFNHKAAVHMYRLENVPTRNVEIRDNDALPPIKNAQGQWVPQPVFREEIIPLV